MFVNWVCQMLRGNARWLSRTVVLVASCPVLLQSARPFRDADESITYANVIRSPQVHHVRPALLSAFLSGSSTTSAVFVLTTSRQSPFDSYFRNYGINESRFVPGCSDAGRWDPDFFDGDLFSSVDFEAIYDGQRYSCVVYPQGPHDVVHPFGFDVCKYWMTLAAVCPLGTLVPLEANVRLRRIVPDIADYGTLTLQQTLLPKRNVNLAACSLINLDSTERTNNVEQLRDWISWHRMIGVELFLLYGVAPPRLQSDRVVTTFPLESADESVRMRHELYHLLHDGDVAYIEFPVKPAQGSIDAFHAVQPASINDCLWRLRDRAAVVKLGDLDEFMHPLNSGMNAQLLSKRMRKDGLPFVPIHGVRWRRSSLSLPESIGPGRIREFDAHEAHPVRFYVKSLVDPSHIVWGVTHIDHQLQDWSGFNDKKLLQLSCTLGSGLTVINHHFGGGGPDEEVIDTNMLSRFMPCLEQSRDLSRLGTQLIASCLLEAQTKFLDHFGENITCLY